MTVVCWRLVMKVLHVINGLDPGGAEIMLMRLLDRFRDRSVDSEVISLGSRGSVGEEIQGMGIPVRALGINRNCPNPLRFIQLRRWIRQSDPDVIQTWMYHSNLLGSLVTITENIPVVWALHASDSEAQGTRWLTRLIARMGGLLSFLPERIVSVSRRGREFHEGIGYDSDRFEVIPNGFDTDQFCPDTEVRRTVREDLGIPQEADLIGHVARLDPQKDHENFFEALMRLQQQNDQFHTIFCGTNVNPDHETIQGYLEQFQVDTDRLHFLGYREDVVRIFQAIDLFVSSSYVEAFPIAVGEAMSCGVPCVVTDVGDSAWLVGETGETVPARDAEALAEAVERVLRMDDESRQELGQRARNRIEQQFSLDAITDRYRDLYRDVQLDSS